MASPRVIVSHRRLRTIIQAGSYPAALEHLASSNRPLGNQPSKNSFATLTETRVDAALASELLDHLLPSDLVNREQLLDNHRLHALLVQHHGNLREVFMQLYDEVERR